MEVTVSTGHTKSQRGTSLVAKTYTSSKGEEVCLLLQVEAAPQDAKTLEKECETVVKHALLETDGEASSRLDGVLKELNGLLKGMTVSQSIKDINAVACIIDTSGVLHVSHVGRAEAYVVRGGVASQITEYVRGKPLPAFVHISSGGLEPRDTIICSTQRLLRTVTPAQLAQLSQRGDQLLDELIVELNAEKEQAALCVMHVGAGRGKAAKALPVKRGRGRKRGSGSGAGAGAILSKITKGVSSMGFLSKGVEGAQSLARGVLSDLGDPKRKKKAHLLLLAGVFALFIIIWVFVQLSTSPERSASKAELKKQLEQIESQLQTSNNRRLAGDTESANLILDQAELKAKQVMDNEAGLFRMEVLDILDRVRAKREEINNIIRLTPTAVTTLTSQNPDITARGFIGLGDEEFIVYDRQDLYRVLLNTVEKGKRLDDEELILGGVAFPRYQTLVFQTTDNSIVELINDVPTSMKTEDPAGWIKGTDIIAYLRYIYILSPENNQIYKYERMSNRYSTPAEYNVNGDLSGALDMTIDGNIYIVKGGGEIVKLLRGEVRPFTIRYAPEDVLKDITRIYKNLDGNIYFLDPVHARVIVVAEGGTSGESTYIKQYVFEGEQMGELQDLYVDPDESRLYVLDEKRIYKVDLTR